MPKPKPEPQAASTTPLESRIDLEFVDVNTIEPNNYNPNRQSTEDFNLLLASMRDDGFTQPVIADRETRQIVDGEHRWRAAQVLSTDPEIGHRFEKIPVVWRTMTEEQRRISTLRHNRARGSEDYDLAADVLRQLDGMGALDYAAESLNISGEELEQILADTQDHEAAGSAEVAAAIAKDPNDNAGIADAMRQAEARIEETRNLQQMQQLTEERDMFRLSLTFTGDESVVVRQALGGNPARRLLELCRLEVGEAA